MSAYDLLLKGARGDPDTTLKELADLRVTRDPLALINKDGRVLIVWTSGETYYAAGLRLGDQALTDWLVTCGVERSEAAEVTSTWPTYVAGVVMSF